MDRLDAMHAFVRLHELGSFTAVADELRISQSTASKWIARLEEQLGVRLVERTSRTRRMTDAGDLFYRRAREMLAAYAALEAELQAGSGVLRGRLRVSAPVVFGQRHIVPLVPDFVAAHPHLELDLVLDDRYVRLVDDGFDLLIRVGTPVDSELRARTFARTARHLVASPAFVQRWGRPRDPEQLAHLPAVLHSGADVWRFRTDGQVDWQRVRVQARFTANSSEALRAMAVAGQGMAILATWLVADDLATGRLVELLPGFALPDAPVQALMPPGPRVHPRTRAFVEHVATGLRLPAAPG